MSLAMSLSPASSRQESITRALEQLAPQQTTWVLQTLRQHEQLRMGEIAQAMPWTSMNNLRHVLYRTVADGLVEQPRYGHYALSARGRAVHSVHQALADWHYRHFSTDAPTAWAERVEDALGRLRLKGTTGAVLALARSGALPHGELRKATGLPSGSTGARFQRMREDGLLTRSGTHHGADYLLTPAGHALSPVYDALATWQTPAARTMSPPVPARQRTTAQAATVRTVRAVPSPFTGLFSHAPQPPAPVPTAVTTASRPTHSR